MSDAVSIAAANKPAPSPLFLAAFIAVDSFQKPIYSPESVRANSGDYGLMLLNCAITIRQGFLKVIALTAHAMNGDDQIALNAGCDGYLTKPINTRTFVATVAAFLRPTTGGEAEKKQAA